MREMMPYIWICIIIFAAVAELHTLALVSVCFIPAALAAFILSLNESVDVWLQVAVFFAAGFILLILSRTVFRRFIKSRKTGVKTDYDDDIIGKTAIVTEEINNYENTGTIRINGILWNAKADDDDIIYEKGLVVTVVEVDGMEAVCSR